MTKFAKLAIAFAAVASSAWAVPALAQKGTVNKPAVSASDYYNHDNVGSTADHQSFYYRQ